MGLLPDTRNCGCACAGDAGNVFPITAGERSRHASRHVRHARAVMHAGIANYRFPLKSAAGENVPGIPGACATCNFTYLIRGPSRRVLYCLLRVFQGKLTVLLQRYTLPLYHLILIKYSSTPYIQTSSYYINYSSKYRTLTKRINTMHNGGI